MMEGLHGRCRSSFEHKKRKKKLHNGKKANSPMGGEH